MDAAPDTNRLPESSPELASHQEPAAHLGSMRPAGRRGAERLERAGGARSPSLDLRRSSAARRYAGHQAQSRWGREIVVVRRVAASLYRTRPSGLYSLHPCFTLRGAFQEDASRRTDLVGIITKFGQRGISRRAESHRPIATEEANNVTISAAVSPTSACDVAEHLPDFALLALPDDQLRRIDEHLDGCPACRAELSHLLDVLATMAMPSVAPPRPQARAAFIARACDAAGAAARTDGILEVEWVDRSEPVEQRRRSD